MKYNNNQSSSASKFICPRCGGKLRKSRTRGSKERVLKFFGKRAFRCRDRECNWRGLIRSKTVKKAINKFIEGNGRAIIVVIFTVLFFVIVLKLILFIITPL